jgi:hypothetical protein
VTPHPTAQWTGQQLRNAFPFEQFPRYLLRDRDAIFGPGLPKTAARLLGWRRGDKLLYERRAYDFAC